MIENLKMQNGVYIPDGTLTDTYFEELYIAVRKKEQRIYSDQELLKLPDIDSSHRHYNEWLVRKVSCENLIKYFKRKKKHLQILEVGCGNGWLANRLSEIPTAKVIGLDINFTELQQAANVFSTSNLLFVYGDIRRNIFQKMQFDAIVFSASIPYFSSIKEILKSALQHLKASGEIHIIDSFFYDNKDVALTKQKCEIYYKSIGISEMANYFFHHSLTDLRGFNFKLLSQNIFLQKLGFSKSVFPWLKIQHFNE